MAANEQWGMGHLDELPTSVGEAQRDVITLIGICEKAGLVNVARRLRAIAQFLETLEPKTAGNE